MTCAVDTTRTSDPRFPIQHLDVTTWLAATSANLAADYAHGFTDAVDAFMAPRSQWARFREQLRAAQPAQLAEFVELRRSESLAFLVMMLTGVCNADCPICFTDRRKKPNELATAERIRVLREAKALGARYVYVPGEGEPTLDAGWWDLLEEAKRLDLPIVAFTNGIVFSDEDTCRRTWRLSCDEAVERLAGYPVSLYLKWWTVDPAQAATMLRVPVSRLAYRDYDGVALPGGLVRMLESGFPRERLGVEVVVERRNVDDVVATIAPYAAEHGLARIVEMLQHNGRTLGDPSYDIDPSRMPEVAPLLSPTSCTQATCKAVITSQGYLSPRIAVLEHQIPGQPADIRDGSLFELLHSTDYVVERRYNLACLCESMPAELSGEASDVPVTTVVPPELADALSTEPGSAHAAAGCTGTCSTCVVDGCHSPVGALHRGGSGAG